MSANETNATPNAPMQITGASNAYPALTEASAPVNQDVPMYQLSPQPQLQSQYQHQHQLQLQLQQPSSHTNLQQQRPPQRGQPNQMYLDHDQGQSSSSSSSSCCKEFWSAPFVPKNYALIFSNILVHFPYMMFTSIWVGTFFCFSVAFLMFFPVGPLLMMFGIVSWRWLGKLELRLHRYAANGSRAYSRTSLCYGGDVCVSTRVHQFCTWDGFWGTLKDLMLSWDSWRPVGYFLLIKPVVAIIVSGVSFSLTVTSLVLIFNFVGLLVCDSCYGGHPAWDWEGAWVVNSFTGCAITIPIGVLLFILNCFLAGRMARWAASVALSALGKKVPIGGDETTPINHPQAQGQGQNKLFIFSTQNQV